MAFLALATIPAIPGFVGNWSNSGHCAALGREALVANDPKRTSARISYCGSEAPFDPFRDAHLSRYDMISKPGGGHEAAGISRDSRKCCGVTNCVCAAVSQAEDRISKYDLPRYLCLQCPGVSRGTSHDRLYRRAKCRNLPLGERRLQSDARARTGVGEPQCCSDSCDWRCCFGTSCPSS